MSNEDIMNGGEPRRWRRPDLGGIAGGLIIVVIGLVLLLDNLNILDSKYVFRLWPVLLIVFGLKRLNDARHSGTAISGVIWASIGALLLLERFDVIHFSIWALWPLLLIAFGVQMLMRSTTGPTPDVATADQSADSFNTSTILGGLKRNIRSQAFRGGSASVLMGGVELDLSKADMQAAEAVIRVSIMMGGVNIRIPETWSLDCKVTPLLGGVEDKTTPPSAIGKRLVLQGSVLIGGIEVRN
jgi:predicted membrane protein